NTRCLSDWSSDVCSSDLLLPPRQSLTNCARAGPVSFFASACLLQTLSEACFTGVADGAAGGAAATAAPQPTMAMAVNAVMMFMRAFLRVNEPVTSAEVRRPDLAPQ